MQAMVEREERYLLGGELSGGTAGRGSENKVPFLAAVSVDANGHPVHAKLTPVSGFTRKAVAAWASAHLIPGSVVVSDGLSCFNGVGDAGCVHQPVVVGNRKPRDLPDFLWVNTVLGNVKTSLAGTYHAFEFGKYAERYLGAIAYRFNRRFKLDTITQRLLVAAAATGPRPEEWLRQAAAPCLSGDSLSPRDGSNRPKPATRPQRCLTARRWKLTLGADASADRNGRIADSRCGPTGWLKCPIPAMEPTRVGSWSRQEPAVYPAFARRRTTTPSRLSTSPKRI